MNPEDLELEAFQSCLLDVLHAFTTAVEIREALLRNPATLAFRDYLDELDSEMLELAAQLVKKWAVKADVGDSRRLQQMPH